MQIKIIIKKVEDSGIAEAKKQYANGSQLYTVGVKREVDGQEYGDFMYVPEDALPALVKELKLHL